MSDAEHIEPFQISFKLEGEPVQFANLEEFKTWINECSRGWLHIRDELDRVTQDSEHAGVINLAKRFVAERMEFFDHFRMICVAITHKENEFKRGVIGDIINNVIEKSTVITPTGNKAQNFKSLYLDINSEKLAEFVSLNDGYFLPLIRKYIHPSFYDMSTGVIADDFQTLSGRLEERVDNIEKNIPEIVRSELEGWLDVEKVAIARESAEKMLADADRKWRDTFDQADASQTKIATMEATLAAQMEVQAPAVYWSENARKYAHTGTQALVLSVVTVLMVSLLSIYGLLYMGSSSFSSDLTNIPEFAVYFLLAVPVICAFVLIRIFTHIYNVSRALSDDNRQRSAMAKSLVSLVQSTEDGLRDEERLVIFRSLFRPSQDATGKDRLDVRHPVEVLVNRMTREGKK